MLIQVHSQSTGGAARRLPHSLWLADADPLLCMLVSWSSTGPWDALASLYIFRLKHKEKVLTHVFFLTDNIIFSLSSLTPISLDCSLSFPSPFIVDTSGGDGLYSDTVGGH